MTALREVSPDVHASEIVAIVSDNGAGKSTLIKAISEARPPDEEVCFFNGKPIDIRGPQVSSWLGIETAYQDLAFCNNLDTVHNLFPGDKMISPATTGLRLRHALLSDQSDTD